MKSKTKVQPFGSAKHARLGQAEQFPHFALEARSAGNAIPAVYAVSAVEVEKYAVGFFQQYDERCKIPRSSVRFNPDIRLTGGDHRQVRCSAQASNRPKLPHPIDHLVREREIPQP